jgi:hypothetical protein
MSLATIQTEFRSQLTQGSSDILRHITDAGQINSAERVSIYENGYFARLGEALATDYKVLWMVLGDDEFYALTKAYILAQPSRYFSLRWFGQNFAQFLSEQQGEHAVMLAQLARLEWAFVDAFTSADMPMLALEKIATVSAQSWPELSFKLHPSLQIIEHDWDILSYWRAGRDEQPFPELEHYQCIQKMLVWRKELTTQYRTLTIEEAFALEIAMQGANFSDICEALLSQNIEENDLAATVIGWLQVWLGEGLIYDIESK